jgi:hypothetical protein
MAPITNDSAKIASLTTAPTSTATNNRTPKRVITTKPVLSPRSHLRKLQLELSPSKGLRVIKHTYSTNHLPKKPSRLYFGFTSDSPEVLYFVPGAVVPTMSNHHSGGGDTLSRRMLIHSARSRGIKRSF